jgi:hypothetical protein
MIGLTFGCPSAAADLGPSVGPSGGATVSTARRPRTVPLTRQVTLVPFCLEMPQWIFGRPVLLKCTRPRIYVEPVTAPALNTLKAVEPPPLPYPQITYQ